MDVQYSGIHSMNFWHMDNKVKKNTWTDFHLIPNKRPFVVNAEPKFTIIKIPGTNKRIDITDFLTDVPTFGSRTGEWEFIIVHDMWENWVNAYNNLCDYFHGHSVIVELTDEPHMYYSGIVTVGNYSSESEYSIIRIKYELNTYALNDVSYDPNDPSNPSADPFGRFPIKFIANDGKAYHNDYGIDGTSTTYLEGDVLYVYDTFVIGSNP